MWEQLKKLTASLSRAQQIGIVVAAIAVVAGLVLFLQFNREKDFKPLFTGLAPEDANQVVTKLKETGTEYRLGDNGSIVLVRSSKVAESRLNVAGSGLPKSGRIGFEIFDKTNFGATDFSEQVNYRRALEGELERSVVSIGEVEQARVHLSFPKESVFLDQRRPAKASVLVKLKRDAILSRKNVTAIEHLVASAVEGLTPEGVTVVDMQGNLLKKIPAGQEDDEKKDSQFDYKQKLEKDLLAKLETTLSPVLGPDHYRAGISVEVDLTSGEQSEETWDPNRSVMATQKRSEELNPGSAASGIPGTASNLPRPTSRPGSRDQGILRRTEDITYQSSRTVRKTTLPKGSIRRLTASLVLDQVVTWDGTGAKAKRILEPPSEETLKKVRDLAAGAIGFSQDRGDQMFVQSLPFETTLKLAPPPDPAAPIKAPAAKEEPPSGLLPSAVTKWLAEKNIKVDPMILIGAGALILLLAVGGVVFLVLKKKKKKKKGTLEQRAAMEEAAPGGGTLPPADTKLPVSTGGQGTSPSRTTHEPPMSDEDRKAEQDRQEMEVLRSIHLPELASKKSEVLIRHISDQARKNPTGTAAMLRGWLAEKEEY